MSHFLMPVCRVLVHLVAFSDLISSTDGTLSFGLVCLRDRISVLVCLRLRDLLHLRKLTVSSHAAHRWPIATHHRLLHILLHLADHLINIAKAHAHTTHRLGEERIVRKWITTSNSTAPKRIFHHRIHHLVGHLVMSFHPLHHAIKWRSGAMATTMSRGQLLLREVMWLS